MFAWILILSAGVALLLLIFHDATKNDSEGSAVLIAAKNIVTLVRWGMPKARGLIRQILLKAAAVRKALSVRFSQANVSKPSPANPKPANLESVVGTGSPSPETTRQAAQSSTGHTPTAATRKKWWSKDARILTAATELELAIAEAVRNAPGCEAFAGVVVRHTRPKSRLDPNWALRGIKFGKADRKIADEALTPIIERMQQEFRLTVPMASPSTPPELVVGVRAHSTARASPEAGLGDIQVVEAVDPEGELSISNFGGNLNEWSGVEGPPAPGIQGVSPSDKD